MRRDDPLPRRWQRKCVADRRLKIVCNLITTRQRPQTAKGILFLLLEDETGMLNVVCRKELWEAQRELFRTEPLLIIRGVLEKKDRRLNLVAEEAWPLSDSLPDPVKESALRRMHEALAAFQGPPSHNCRNFANSFSQRAAVSVAHSAGPLGGSSRFAGPVRLYDTAMWYHRSISRRRFHGRRCAESDPQAPKPLFEAARSLARKRGVSLNSLVQEQLGDAVREERQRRIRESFDALASCTDEDSNVEWMIPLQREALELTDADREER